MSNQTKRFNRMVLLALLVGAITLQGCSIIEAIFCPGCEDLPPDPITIYEYECFWENGSSDYRYYIEDDMELDCDDRTRECVWTRDIWSETYDTWLGYPVDYALTWIWIGGPAKECMAQCGNLRNGGDGLCTPPTAILLEGERVHSSEVERSGLIMSAQEPSASFSGSLWEAHSTVRVTHSSFDISVPVRGEIWIKGGDCPYFDECPIELTYMSLENTGPIHIEDVTIDTVKLRNSGIWAGVKKADDTFSLHSSASLSVTLQAGDRITDKIAQATGPIAGSYNWGMANPFGAPFMRVTADYVGDSSHGPVTFSLDLVFKDDDLAPVADYIVQPTAFSSCTDVGGDFTSNLILDARSSYHPLDEALVSYTWYDGQNNLLGTTSRPCYGTDDICPVGPIRLEVKDARGRTSRRENDYYPLRGTPADSEQYGREVATGDFNGDGYKDLVVGIPYDDGTDEPERHYMYCAPDPDGSGLSGPAAIKAGSVQIILGGKWGLHAKGNQLWNQDVGRVYGVREDSDQFGAALAVGDFDNDNFDDIAIGVPGEGLGSGRRNDGMVNVLYGSVAGMSDRRGSSNSHTYFHQSRSDVLGSKEEGDKFGFALSAGDFNNDGFADLAVGVPGEDAQGIVQVFYGGEDGLSAASDVSFGRADLGVEAVSGQQFGHRLAAADLNGDQFDDLIVGAPGNWYYVPGGSISVVYGSSAGIDTSHSLTIEQADLDAISQGFFGFSLATGRFNNDEYVDVAVGSPTAVVGGDFAAGSVTLFFGSDTGLSISARETVTQDTRYRFRGGVYDVSEPWDLFGWSLAAGRLDNNSTDDLVVGAKSETLSGIKDTGIVHVLYTAGRSREVFNLRRDQRLSQATLPGESQQSGDNFGFSVALGDFDNNDFDDLVVGVPYEDTDGFTNAGIIQLAYSNDDTGRLSTSAPPDFCHPQTPVLGQGDRSLASPTYCLY